MTMGFQPMLYDLGTQDFVAGQTLSFPFKTLPVMLNQALPHAIFADVIVTLTPAYTTAPTLVQLQNAIKNFSFFDGLREWFPQGGTGNMIRSFGRLQVGDSVLPESLLGAGTGNPKYMKFRIYLNPKTLIGQPADSAYAFAFLAAGGGRIAVTCPALLDLSGDCTACTGQYSVKIGYVNYFDKLVFPGYHTWQMQAVASGQTFTQRALYTYLAGVKSTAFDAITAGFFGNVTLNFSGYLPLQTIPSTHLIAAFQADMQRAQFGIAGEPINATYDVASRQVNLTTPTALAAQANDLTPWAWVPPGTRLSKLAYFAPTQFIPTFSGAPSGAQMLMGRFEPMTQTERGQQLATALSQLPGRAVMQKGWGLRLDSGKDDYTGPYADFFPWEAKLNRT